MRRLALLLLGLPALAACTAGATSPTGDFRLLTLDGQPLQGSASMTLGADGAVHGDGPCNLWNATNTAAPPAFRLTPIASTRRACLVEGGEGAYFAALQAADRIALDGNRLEVSGGGHSLVFARE